MINFLHDTDNSLVHFDIQMLPLNDIPDWHTQYSAVKETDTLKTPALVSCKQINYLTLNKLIHHYNNNTKRFSFYFYYIVLFLHNSIQNIMALNLKLKTEP